VTKTLTESVDAVETFLVQESPRGARAAILTNAGGPGLLAANAARLYGLEIPPLSPATRSLVARELPAAAFAENPLDLLATATPDLVSRAIQVVGLSGEVDALLLLFMRPSFVDPGRMAEAVVSTLGSVPVPAVLCWMGGQDLAPSARILRASGLPVFQEPHRAAKALALLAGALPLPGDRKP